MIKYIIQKLFSKKIKPSNKPKQKMVRIFLAMQVRTDRSQYKVYIDGRETDILLNISHIIGLLNKEQFQDFMTRDETIFLVPFDRLMGNEKSNKKLSGKKTNPDDFNIKNGLIK